MAVFLCIFASNSEKSAAELLRHTALHVADIDHVVLFDEDHPLIKTLKAKASDTLRFEWNFWKPYIIHLMLHNVQDNDIVIYCDPTVSFTRSIQPHLNMLDTPKTSHILLFRPPDYKASLLKQKFYCKQDCFDLMKCTIKKYKEAYQIDSRFQIYRKCPATMKFVEKYVEFCSSPEIMDNVYRTPNMDEFKQHCHEQSVLTNLVTMHATKILVTRFPYVGDQPDPLKMYLDSCLQDTGSLSLPEVHKTYVITPTIGTDFLARCVKSVQSQTLLGVEHLIVVDGPQYAEKVHEIIDPYRLKKPIHVMVLPFNTGADKWLGHKIYAAVPHLLESKFVSYLDEDNWVDPDHLKNMQEIMMAENLDWSFSLRKIHDVDGNFICNDNCESLGNVCHTVLAWNDFLVDTSCFLFKKDVAIEIAPHNMHQSRSGGMEPDRAITKFLLMHPSLKGKGVPKYSLNYTVSHVEGQSVSGDFFVKGNDILKYDFANRPNLYIFHFNVIQTQQFLVNMHKHDRSHVLDEWCMTLLTGLRDKFNLINGYAVEDLIPSGALIYVSLCHVHELPQKILKRRDVHRIVYTLESPNIRHQAQWDMNFLKTHFDHLLTYWEPLLKDESFATFCPHNTHHLDFDNPHDMALLHTTSAPVTNKSVVIVLERRDLEGDYSINDTPLKCLDKLRSHYVKDLTDITAYGLGWGDYRENPNLKVGHTFHRSLDPKKSVDYYKDFTFVLIIENTDADGYVSEKVYDVLMAGAIPLYYGNNNSRVNIPNDMFIDLHKFKTSKDLQKYLDSLTIKDVQKMRDTILQKREQVLKTVSTQAFATTFQEVVNKLS